MNLINRIFLIVALLLSFSSLASEYKNALGIVFVDIPAGDFMMGSCSKTEKGCVPVDQIFLSFASPRHKVTIWEFQMGRTEVTLGQFMAFIQEAKRTDIADARFSKINSRGDNAPVVGISWNQAQDFIAWLNKKEGGGYRLPTEAEWEYACRAGSDHTYCGSDNIEEVAWYGANSGRHQHPVAGKKPNKWGLYDMSGNASEWVEDCWHVDYKGAPSHGTAWISECYLEKEFAKGWCSDPVGAALNDMCRDWRVFRGGSYMGKSEMSHSAFRFSIWPANNDADTGFRVVRTRK